MSLLNKKGLEIRDRAKAKIGLDQILSGPRTAKTLLYACRKIDRLNATDREFQNIGGPPARQCDGDHTLFHTTDSVEDVVNMLEVGIQGRQEDIKSSKADYLPATFSAGYPLIRYGKIVLVTHTRAFKEADRPVVHRGIDDYHTDKLAERLYAPSLEARMAGLRQITHPIAEQIWESLAAAEMTPNEKNVRFQEEYLKQIKPYKSTEAAIKWRSGLAIAVYSLLQRIGFAPSPCEYLAEVERRTEEGESVNPFDLELAKEIRGQITEENAEHMLLGFPGEYIMPSDGIGVGLISDDIENDPIANELRRKGIWFKYLPDNSGLTDQSDDTERLLTHKDFQKQGNSAYLSSEVYADLHRRSSGKDAGFVRNGNHRTWGRGGAGIMIIAPDSKEVLLLKRSYSVEDPGLLGISGGARKETTSGLEDTLVTAVTESTEEMGGLPAGRMRRQPVAYQVPGTSFTYFTHILEVDKAERNRFRPELNWENTAWGWHKMSSLRNKPLHPGVRAVLEKIV